MNKQKTIAAIIMSRQANAYISEWKLITKTNDCNMAG